MNTFAAALENAILEQQRDGIICPVCGKTRVEHYYKATKTCGSLDETFGGALNEPVAEVNECPAGWVACPEDAPCARHKAYWKWYLNQQPQPPRQEQGTYIDVDD